MTIQTIDQYVQQRKDRTSLSLVQGPGAPKTLTTSFIALCPHCGAMIEGLNEWGPVIARSDGKSFHLLAADKPIFYPVERRSGRSELASVGFWYVHDRYGPSTETVVVLLRHPPRHPVSVLRQVEMVADRLADLLTKISHLPCLYEFYGSRLIARPY